ncbi:MAG: extracellular solute-binding protein [Treponema sp.]|jgi:raffinose/stachyose/melibiose transport system substrate-binding protein|nr:extracellular solute-binding protein [Treponema sp.]
MEKLLKNQAFILCIILVAGIISGCGGTGEKGAESGVKLVWFTEQMDDVQYERWMKYVVSPFNEQHPGVTVEISASADYEQVLRIQLSSGAGPDICNLGGPSLTSEYVKGDKLLDITDYVNNSGLDKRIFRWALDSCRINGKLYSLPNSYEALLLWYNEDLFARNNWKPPVTYDDFTALSNAIQAKGIIPIAFGTSNFKAINEQFVSVAFADYAGRENVKKALNNELKWTEPVFLGSITVLNDMWQKGWINDKKSHAISSDEAYSLFYMEQAAMAMTGTWALDTFGNQITDFKYNAVPFPSLRDGVEPTIPFGAGGVVSINAATKNPDECFSFIKFIFDNTANQAKAVGEGAQPLPVDADESLYPSAMREVDKRILNMLEVTQGNLQQAGHVMWTYWPAETRQYMMDNIENVYLGRLTPADYLARSQEIFAKEYAEGKVIPVN